MSTDNPMYFTDSTQTSAGILRGRKVDNFYSYSGVQLTLKTKLIVNEQRNLIARVVVKNAETPELIALSGKIEMNFFQKDEFIRSYELVPGGVDTASKVITGTSSEQVYLPPGKYLVKLAISSSLPGYSSLNSSHFKLDIK